MLPELWFDIYPFNNPKAGARLIRLTKAELLAGSFFRVERRGTGAGKLVLNSGQAGFVAANLHEENLVEVGDANVSASDPLGGFFLHRGDYEVISADEAGGQDFGLGGPGLLAYLAREIMWSHSYLSPDIDGSIVFAGQDPFTDTWRLSEAGTGSTLGAMLWRAVYEATHFPTGPYFHQHGDGTLVTDSHADDRPSNVLTDLVLDFDNLLDSDGNAWAAYNGAFEARVKQQLLSVVLDLVGKGMDVQMRGGRQLTLSAFNSYGRDLRGGAFGAGVVRFVHAANIANPARRAIEAGLQASRALVGSDDEYAVVASPVGFHVPRSVGVDSDAEDAGALAIDGAANLRDRHAGSDVPALKVLYGDDEASGRYLFAPPEVGGHAWVGDLVKIHRGTGAFQWNNADARIEAIQFDLTDDKVWDDPTVEFGSVYHSVDERGRAAAIQAIAGKPHGPHIQLCLPRSDSGAASCALDPSAMDAISTPNGDLTSGLETNWTNTDDDHTGVGSGVPNSLGPSGNPYLTNSWLGGSTLTYTGWNALTFLAGVTYVCRVWFAGTGPHELRFGLVGTDFATIDPADAVGSPQNWNLYCFEWTPSADRTGVTFKAVRTGTGTTRVDDLAAYSGTAVENPLNGTDGRARRCDSSEHEISSRLPGVDDDAAAGYPRRTIWHVVGGATYISLDDSTGAAVWDLLAGTGTHDHLVGDLADVDVTVPPTDGQVLVYDDVAETWIPEDPSGGAVVMSDLTDADTAGVADLDFLRFNATDGEWQPATVTPGATAITVQQDGQTAITDVDHIVFEGATVTDDGAGQVTVTITGGSMPFFGDGSGATLRGANTATGATPLTLTKPAGTAAGDLLIIAIQTVNSIPDVAGPSAGTGAAWNVVHRVDTSSNEWQAIYWKVANGSEPASYTFAHSAGVEAAAAIVAFDTSAGVGLNDVWHRGYNVDSLLSPAILGHPEGLHVIVWMNLGIISMFTEDAIGEAAYAAVVGGNAPQVLIAYRDTTSEISAPGLRCNGADSQYTLGFAVVFYDNTP